MVERYPFELRHSDEPERIIRGRLVFRGGAPPPASVLLVHGHRGFMDWAFFPELARRIAEAGLTAVAFNLSGSGIGADLRTFSEPEAFASNTYTRELEDLERVRASLPDLLPDSDPGRRALFGHSRGGGMALLHAARHGDYRALCLWAPMHRVALFGAESRRGFHERGHILSPLPTGGRLRLDRSILDDAEQNRERLDIARACRVLRSPTRILYGERDRLVREGAPEALEAAFPRGVAELHRIPGGNHSLGARHPLDDVPPPLARGLELTVEWLARHLGEPARDPVPDG